MYAKSVLPQQSFWGRSLTVLIIIVLLLVSLQIVPVSAAETEYFSPSVATINGTTAWANPSYSFASDDQYASTSGKNKGLTLSYFNITPIQGNSVISGIAVTVEGHTDGRQADIAISGDGGTTWSIAKNTALPTGSVDSVQSLGGSSDLWQGVWTAENFTSANFLVKVTSTGTNASGTLYVDQVQVKIYFQPPNATVTVSPVSENYGTGATTLTATLTETIGSAPISGMTIDFTLNDVSVGNALTDGSGVATLSGVDISSLASGTYDNAIRADFVTAGGYEGTFGLADLVIVGIPLTVTADPQARYYGYPDPTLTYQYTGTLLPGDSFSGNLLRDPGEAPGDYWINQGTLTAGPGYTITYVGDFLTVNPAPLTVTATSFAKPASDPDITDFTFIYSGFVFGENESVLTTAPVCGLEVGVDQSVPGTYPITCSGGLDDSYSFIYVDGSLIVAPVAEPPLELLSVAAEDGWTLESGETTGKGGKINAGATTIRIGDDALNRQYRSILSFNTSALPANAVITKVTLRITYQGKTGTNPFNTHKLLLVDLKTSTFGTSALQKADFQTTATLMSAGIIGKTPVSLVPNVYESVLTQTALDSLNANIGFTQMQLRLRFQKDDNNDFGADFLKFYSGNSSTLNTQPVLIIEYTVVP
jgi:hypothetical protein